MCAVRQGPLGGNINLEDLIQQTGFYIARHPTRSLLGPVGARPRQLTIPPSFGGPFQVQMHSSFILRVHVTWRRDASTLPSWLPSDHEAARPRRADINTPPPAIAAINRCPRSSVQANLTTQAGSSLFNHQHARQPQAQVPRLGRRPGMARRPLLRLPRGNLPSKLWKPFGPDLRARGGHDAGHGPPHGQARLAHQGL